VNVVVNLRVSYKVGNIVTCISKQRREKHLPAEARDNNTRSLLGYDSVYTFQKPRNSRSCVLCD
jgi:hypothetical protein